MIVVTTPTGPIGRHVVQDLLAAGESVRVIARDSSRLPQEVTAQVEVVQGNHNDPGVTMTAFEGADSVFYVVPPDTSTDDVHAHYRAFAEAVAPASPHTAFVESSPCQRSAAGTPRKPGTCPQQSKPSRSSRVPAWTTGRPVCRSSWITS